MDRILLQAEKVREVEEDEEDEENFCQHDGFI